MQYPSQNTAVSIAIGLAMAVAGLLLIIVAEWMPEPWDGVASHLGVVLAVVVALHWVFDFASKAAVIQEAVTSAFGHFTLRGTGIVAFAKVTEEAKDSIEQMMRFQGPLIIGLHHNEGFVKRWTDELKKRLSRQYPTLIFVSRPGSNALKFYDERQQQLGHDNRILDESTVAAGRVGSILEAISRNPDGRPNSALDIVQHDELLRYSFMATTEAMWITFQKNCGRRASAPALNLTKGGDLFEFVLDDIQALVKAYDKEWPPKRGRPCWIPTNLRSI